MGTVMSVAAFAQKEDPKKPPPKPPPPVIKPGESKKPPKTEPTPKKPKDNDTAVWKNDYSIVD